MPCFHAPYSLARAGFGVNVRQRLERRANVGADGLDLRELVVAQRDSLLHDAMRAPGQVADNVRDERAVGDRLDLLRGEETIRSRRRATGLDSHTARTMGSAFNSTGY